MNQSVLSVCQEFVIFQEFNKWEQNRSKSKFNFQKFVKNAFFKNLFW